MRLPRTQRLRRAAEFDATRRGRYRARDSLFAITAVEHEGAPRLGLAVSRRVSGKAVTRNRIKRQIRESFRSNQQMLQGLDIFVVAQPPAAHSENAALAKSLHALWQRLARR